MPRTARLVMLALATLAAVPAVAAVGAGDAQAVVGRPLTPLSYAGVARRTTRRSVRRHAAVASTAYPAGTVTSLPAGCVRSTDGGAVHYGCGSTTYRPYYQGSVIVYRQAP